jgi:hypothetical protein
MPRLKEKVSPIPTARYFTYGDLIILVGREPIDGNGKKRWHLSISHPARFPSWDEIKFARYELCPKDITMAMLLPPAEAYVNIHPNCFHLWQIHPDDENAMQQGGF